MNMTIGLSRGSSAW